MKNILYSFLCLSYTLIKTYAMNAASASMSCSWLRDLERFPSSTIGSSSESMNHNDERFFVHCLKPEDFLVFLVANVGEKFTRIKLMSRTFVCLPTFPVASGWFFVGICTYEM